MFEVDLYFCKPRTSSNNHGEILPHILVHMDESTKFVFELSTIDQ